MRSADEASSLGGSSGSRAERNSQSIEGVHQADRIGEVSEFLVAEFGGSGFIVGIGNAGFGHARHGFRPGERERSRRTEYFARVAPHRHQDELVHRQRRA